ncbi:hypothetical protein Cci01nite_54560 [Catellatospora citrea]|uniref:Uncharacterized protein n=1 Tax=Catellatospora citrea TaxID=53366 RepID=A0A8J3P1U4_9ACTN|nr:hypothetical protein Cci01nite_54560 [Catellatospora citrea]
MNSVSSSVSSIPPEVSSVIAPPPPVSDLVAVLPSVRLVVPARGGSAGTNRVKTFQFAGLREPGTV